MGTLSKEMAPGLRIGWVVEAPDLIDALTIAKQAPTCARAASPSALRWMTLEDGLVDRMQPALVSLYRKRRDALCAAMAEYLTEWFEWEVPLGGMFLWATARDPAFNRQASAMLHRGGVCVAPGIVLDVLIQNKRSIRINFTFNPPDRSATAGIVLRARPGKAELCNSTRRRALIL
jgi:2-aminoadipate transaminase